MIYATLLASIDYPCLLILNEEIRRHDPDARHYVFVDRRGQIPRGDRNGGFARIDRGQTDWGERLDTKDACLEEMRWFLKLSAENGGKPVIKIDSDVWVNDWLRLRRVYTNVEAGAVSLVMGAQPRVASATGPAYIIQPCDEIVTALTSMTLDRYPEDKCVFAACAAAGKKALLVNDLWASNWFERAEGNTGRGVFAHAGEPMPGFGSVPRQIALERMIYSRALRDLKKDLDKANSTKLTEPQTKTEN